jgi:hypothetical protein
MGLTFQLAADIIATSIAPSLAGGGPARRYRSAARHAQMIDSGMSHIGFRCFIRGVDHRLSRS